MEKNKMFTGSNAKDDCISELKKSPCCNGKLVMENNEIRCDDCDLILAEKIKGDWMIWD